MNIKEISELPSTVQRIPTHGFGVHESTLRAYQILRKTKDYLKRGVPADVILELIEEMEERKEEVLNANQSS